MNSKRLSELRYKGHITDSEYKELKLAIKEEVDRRGQRMSKEQEAIEELKEMDSYAYQEEAEAIAEAIKALEVVEQIKRDYVSNYVYSDKVDAISNTLQKAYGDISVWRGEYKEKKNEADN